MPEDPEAQQVESQPDPAAIAQAQADLAAARAEADTARRELVFAKAGIDTDTPGGELLLAGYKGELEVDKLREFAIATNVIANPAHAATAPVIPAEEQAATAERQALANGADPGALTPDEKDPMVEGREIFFRAEKDGASFDEAMGYFVNYRANAAAKGDKRVTVDFQQEQRRGRRFKVEA